MQYITKILVGIILAVSMLSSAYAESTNDICKGIVTGKQIGRAHV